jgi:hypothetical protein
MPGAIIKSVKLDAPSFVKCLKKLPPNILIQAKENIKAMIGIERMPSKLHYHKMNGYEFWCIHISSCSKYKASFTVEDGVAIFRKAGEHDRIDRSP